MGIRRWVSWMVERFHPLYELCKLCYSSRPRPPRHQAFHHGKAVRMNEMPIFYGVQGHCQCQCCEVKCCPTIHKKLLSLVVSGGSLQMKLSNRRMSFRFSNVPKPEKYLYTYRDLNRREHATMLKQLMDGAQA